MKTITLQSEDFKEIFSLSDAQQMSPGNYMILENGRIKHHNNVIITVDGEVYYLTSFNRTHDDDVHEILEDAFSFVQKKSTSKHPSETTIWIK